MDGTVVVTIFNRVPPKPPVVLTGANAAVVDPGTGSSSGGSGGPVVAAGVYYDWLIDGIPLLLWPSDDDPYVRDTKEDVKDQFDSSREPGEQSFGYWWLRSQATYGGGAGQSYLDTGQADINRTRFYSSAHLNPFTAGQVSVNPTFSRQVVNRAGSALVSWSGAAKLATISGTDNTVVVATVPGLTSPTTISVGTGGVCQAVTTDGENLFVAVNDKIYKIDSAGTVTQIASITFVGPVSIGFAKQRIIACTGPKVYEVDPAGIASASLIYTNPSPNWQYTAVADGPNGIYLAGYLGPLSELSLMAVESSGSGLTLGQPVVQLRTPPSEIIRDVAFYLNAFFGLATSNGMRIGNFTLYGQPQYGPLLNAGNPTSCVSGSGSLLYFGGVNRIWAVDLGTQVEQGRYAYAEHDRNLNPNDDTDSVISLEVAVVDNQDHLFGVQKTGVVIYQAAVPTYPASGTLTTSWARFGTVEPKRMHYIRVEGTFPVPISGQAMTVTIESIDGATTTFNVPGGKTFYEFGVSPAFATSEAFRVKFTLAPGTVLRSWQMKTRPAPLQYQEFILPFGLYDHEVGADGQETGYTGFCFDRLLQLEEAARQNKIVTAVDRWSNTQFQAQISRMQFRQTVLPGRTDRNGGKATIVLRLV